MSDLSVITADINSIYQDPVNARTHSDEQLQSIAASLKRFGLQKPLVVDKDNIIIAGNGTHLAARDILGWTTIAVVVSELSIEEARAYGIADNQIATQSEWDLTTLSKHIKNLSEWDPLQDWKAIGFNKEVIDPIVEEINTTNALTDFLGGEPAVSASDQKIEMGRPIKVTVEQREIIDQAINIVRLQVEDYRTSEGRCMELLCADYLAGAIEEHAEQTDEPEEKILLT